MPGHDEGREPTLLPCPFCGHELTDFANACYQNGRYWAVDERGWRHLYRHADPKRPKDAQRCFNVVCPDDEGGCCAEVNADSREEAIAKWNRRALAAAPAESFEVRNNPDGTLDEVVGAGFVHLEQMDTGHWWLGFGSGIGFLHVNLTSRNKIKATVMDERPAAATPPAGA